MYIRDCKGTEYFAEIQSSFIGILHPHSLANTNYMLLFCGTTLGKLVFFSNFVAIYL